MAKQGNIKFGVQFQVDKAGLKTIETELKRISNMSVKDVINSTSIADATSKLNAAKTAATQMQQALEAGFNVKLNTVNLEKFQQSLKDSGTSLNKLQADLSHVDGGTTAFRNMTAQLLTTNKHLRESSELLTKMGNTLANTIRWSIASTAINSVTGSIQKAWSFTKQLDTSLNDIMIVTGKSADEMERFAVKANKAAKELGASTKAYSDASLIYYQQGLSDQEVAARSSVTVKAANVTGQSAQQVSEQLTAVWNGYKVSAQESEIYIDKLAAVAAKTAADLEELSTGMSRVASAANIMGVDIDQLNAQLATIVSVTREAPESIGTALKTVYARMSDLEAGLDAETTLGEYTTQMANFGIQALDANGKLRDMGDVVEEIGNRWNTLSRNQQVALAQTIAGTRQYSRMMSLFDNWDMYQDALKTSKSSAGTLQKQQDTYMESTEAHLEKLGATAEDLYASLFNTEDMNDLIDILAKLVDGVDNFVEAIGGGAGVLRNFGTIAFNVFNKQIANSAARAVTNMQGFFDNQAQEKAQEQLLRDLNIDAQNEEGVKEILRLKNELNGVEQMLTKEQKEQGDEYIKQTAELYKQKDNLTKQVELARELTKVTTDGLIDLDADASKWTAQDTVDAKITLDSHLEAYQQAQADRAKLSTDLYLSTLQSKRFSRSALALAQKDRQAELSKEALKLATSDSINAQRAANDQDMIVSSQRLEEAKERNRLATEALVQAEQKYNTVSSESRTQAKDFIIALEGIQQQYDTLINTEYNQVTLMDSLSGAQKKQADEAQIIINKYKQGDASVEQYIEALRTMFHVFDQGEDNLKSTIAALDNLSSEVKKNKQDIKNAGDSFEYFSRSFDTKKIVSNITTVTSRITSLVSAVQTLSSLDDIWNNDDLTTGEKFAQTLMNISMAAGMLLPNIISIVGAYKAYKAEQISSIVLSGTELFTKNKVNKEYKEQVIAQLLNAKSTDQITKEKNEEIAARIKNGQFISKENQEYIEQVITQNGTNFGSFVKDKGKAGLTKAGKGVVKAGKAVGKGAVAVAGKVGALVGGGAVAGAATLGIAAAAIAGITVGIVKLVQAYNKEKTALKQAKEEQERMNNALEKAQSEYNNLTSALDNYRNAQNAFDDLTKGTTEWNRALAESNEQVLKLLETYPELIQYTQRNAETGALEISEAGMAMVEADAFGKMASVQNAKLVSDQAVRQAQIAYDKEMLLRNSATMDFQSFIQGFGNFTGLGFTDAIGAMRGNDEGEDWGFFTQIARGENPFKDNVTTDQLNKILKEVDLATVSSGEELKNILETKGIKLEDNQLYDSLIENKEALIKLQNSIDENNRLVAIENAQIYQNLLMAQGMDAEKAGVLSGLLGADQQDEDYTIDGKTKDEWIADWTEQERKKRGNNKDIIEEWAAIKGISIDDIKATGGSSFKYIDEEGNEQKVSYDTLAQDMAAYEFNKRVTSTENIEKYQDKLNTINANLSDQQAKTAISAVIGSSTGLDVNSLKNYSTQTLTDLKKIYEENIGDLPDVTKKALKETIENMEEALIKFGDNQGWAQSVQDAIKSFGDEYEVTLKDGTKTTISALDTQTQKFIGNMLQEFENVGGTHAVDSIRTLANNLGENSIDFFKSVDMSAENLHAEIIEQYENLGGVWDVSKQECIDATWAIARMNGEFSSSRETYKQITDIVSTLNEKGATISAEEFDSLYQRYGSAINSYFTLMADGTRALTVTAKEFANITSTLEKEVLWNELEKFKKDIDQATAAATTIKEKNDLLTYSKTNEASLAQARQSIRNATSITIGDHTFSTDDLKTGANIGQAEAQIILKEYLKGQGGIETLKSLVKGGWADGYSINDEGNIVDVNGAIASASAVIDAITKWNKITQSTGGDTLTVDLKAGAGATTTFDYTSLGQSILEDRANNVNINEHQAQFYNAAAIQNWIKSAESQGMLTSVQANEFLTDATEENLKIENGNNDLVNRIREAMGASSFDTKALTDFIDRYLQTATSDTDVDTIWTQIEGLYGTDILQKLQLGTETYKDMMNRLKQNAKDAVELKKLNDQLADYETQLEAIEKINSEYEQMNSLLEHQRSLIELTAGENAYSEIGTVLSDQIDTIEKQLENSRNAAAYWQNQMVEALANNQTELYEAAKANWEDASNAYYENMSQKIELLKEEYLNSVDAMFAAQEKLWSGGYSMDYLEVEWDITQKRNDAYLDPVNAEFEKLKIENKYSTALNDAQSLNAQKRIKDLMEDELSVLEDKDKLSEYDLKRAEARLEVTKAQIALEEAQANKSKMRLTRGADGTYSYQYIADVDAVTKAQETLAQAQQDLYNLDVDEYEANLEEALSLYQEYKEKMREISQIEDKEEREAQMQLLQEEFGGLLTDIFGDNESIKENLAASFGMAASGLGEDFGGLTDAVAATNMQLATFVESMNFETLSDKLDDLETPWEKINQTTEEWSSHLKNAQAIVTNIADTMKNATWSGSELTLTEFEDGKTGWDGEAIGQSIVDKLKEIHLQEEKDENGETIGWSWKIASAATGMYTGEWGPEGRLAVLHEKELVLNKTDTANILQAIDMIRTLENALSASMLENILSKMGGNSNPLAALDLAKDLNLEQNVHITAEFPNATDKSEIEAAFDELLNLATQQVFENKRE